MVGAPSIVRYLNLTSELPYSSCISAPIGSPCERLASKPLILLSSQVHLRWKSGSCVFPLCMLDSKSERFVSFDLGAGIAMNSPRASYSRSVPFVFLATEEVIKKRLCCSPNIIFGKAIDKKPVSETLLMEEGIIFWNKDLFRKSFSS